MAIQFIWTNTESVKKIKNETFSTLNRIYDYKKQNYPNKKNKNKQN